MRAAFAREAKGGSARLHGTHARREGVLDCRRGVRRCAQRVRACRRADGPRRRAGRQRRPLLPRRARRLVGGRTRATPSCRSPRRKSIRTAASRRICASRRRAPARCTPWPPGRPASSWRRLRRWLPRVSPPDAIVALALDLKPGDDIDTRRIAATLVDAGFTHQDPVDEHGEFCIRGGVIDIFPAGDDLPARIELVGDTIEAMRRYAPDTQRSVATIERLKVVPLREVVGESGAARAVLRLPRRRAPGRRRGVGARRDPRARREAARADLRRPLRWSATPPTRPNRRVVGHVGEGSLAPSAAESRRRRLSSSAGPTSSASSPRRPYSKSWGWTMPVVQETARSPESGELAPSAQPLAPSAEPPAPSPQPRPPSLRSRIQAG